MSKPQQIQIDIDKPCHEDWEKMTPCEQGRHCAQCNKTVIDFTTWSDAALYRLFSKYPGNVCGRFYEWQLGRPISIPPQPHSRLYRMVVAMGLTLMAVQGVDVHAQTRPPQVQRSAAAGEHVQQDAGDKARGALTGTITDELRATPFMGCLVQLRKDGEVVAQVTTGFNGQYTISGLAGGVYTLEVYYMGQCKMRLTDVVVYSWPIVVDISFDPQEGVMRQASTQKKILHLHMPEHRRALPDINGPARISQGGAMGRPFFSIADARRTGTICIVADGPTFPPFPWAHLIAPPPKDSLLTPGRRIYNRDEVQRMQINPNIP